MKHRFTTLTALAFAVVLSSCTDPNTSLIPEEGTNPGTQSGAEISDGSQPGGNPHFFWLNPFINSKNRKAPKQLFEVFDPTVQPSVTLCPLEASWNASTERCNDGEAVVVYSSDPDGFEEPVVLDLQSEKYSVIYKSADYPLPIGVTHRVAVAIAGKTIGWADLAVYDPSLPSHAPGPGNFTTDDVLLLNGTENQNIAFRIDEGALEQAFCDSANIEDCDVALIDPTDGTTTVLRTFENPGLTGEMLGTQATVPPGILGPDGLPYQEPFPVILELQLDGDFQPGTVPTDRQVPYFADLWSPVDGLYFDRTGPGVDIVVCQDLDGIGSIPEYLHEFLVVFLTRTTTTGSTTELLPTTPGAAACEGFDPHTDVDHVADAGAKRGLFAWATDQLTRAAKSLLPSPLYAKRRLHGGLNTTVYEVSGDDGGEEEEEADLAPSVTLSDPEPETIQLGAVLNVDPTATSTTVTFPSQGTIGEPSTITVTVLDAQEEPFLFEIGVTIQVSGANTATETATFLGDGVYQASYTPTSLGEDVINVTLEQDPFLPQTTIGPYTSSIVPVAPDPTQTTYTISQSEAGSTTTVTVSVVDADGNAYVDGGSYPIQVAISVDGGGTETVTIFAEDDDGNGNFDGTYEATYTPPTYGTFQVAVVIGPDGVPLVDLVPVSGSPQTVKTLPRPADPLQSEIQVDDGQVGSSTPVSVVVRNTAGETYDYGEGFIFQDSPDFARPITVTVNVSGANSTSFTATDPDLDGTYEGSYTPSNPGPDVISATLVDATDDTVDDNDVPSANSEVAPLSGPFTVQVQISGPAAEFVYGLPVELYDASGATFTGSNGGRTASDGTITFADVPYGFDYTVYLAGRDFDVDFPAYTQTVSFDQTTGPVTFQGTSQALPESVLVYRIGVFHILDELGNGEYGNGNAFEYTVGGRSWTSANNQVRDYFLLGVDGHLATLTSEGENKFAASFFTTFENLCPNATNLKQCKFKGWIGLSDEAQEGTYEWVTDEAYIYDPNVFNGWPGGTEPIDRKGNEDYVEINAEGEWSITNGASTTNEGYFTEWEAAQPTAPTFGGTL